MKIILKINVACIPSWHTLKNCEMQKFTYQEIQICTSGSPVELA
jgi:hypothetical protein